MLRTLLAGCLACGLAGCALVPERADLLTAEQVSQRIEAVMGYPPSVTASSSTVPSLRQLAATVSASRPDETVVALVFYDEAATRLPVGASSRELAGMDVVRDRNVLLLYSGEPPGGSHLPALRRALSG